MEKLLAGKSAIVTGSGRGLGAALAMALANDGARVLVTSRNAERAAAVVERIRSQGGAADGLTVDVAEPDAHSRIVQAAVEAFGGLDILINNAGVFIWRKLEDVTRADWERTLATNLSAPFYLMQSAARAMRAGGRGGAILNIASIHGRYAEAEVAPQSAAKFGLVGLTQAGAAALREHDIRVNAICPGAIEADSSERRGGSPREKVTQADIASLAVYLVSDLSRSITGSVIDAFGSTRLLIKI